MRVTHFYAIAPTAFDGAGGVDGAAVADNVARIAAHGVTGVLLTGSYGEFQVLRPDERISVTDTVVRANPEAVVMSGAAALNGDDAIDIGARLLEVGAHQVMVSAPFAAELTDADLLVHFERIGDALKHDLIVYNNPVFGTDVSPAVLERVTRMPAYTGVKQGTKALAAMVETIARVQSTGQGQVLAAADMVCAAAVGAGVGGVTSTNVWVFPEAFITLADPAVPPASKAAVLAALQPYATLVRSLGQPRVVKAAMVLRGYAGTARVRAPYRPLDETETGQLASALAETDDLLAAAVGT